MKRLLLAESHLTRGLFGVMLAKVWALPEPTGQVDDAKRSVPGDTEVRKEADM